MMKKGFTLIELLVVIAMIAILTGAAGSAVMKARVRSQVARATTEVREITNAILAYENYDDNHSLSKYVTGDDTWKEADGQSLEFILGGADEGRTVPVLYNGSLTRGMLLDPWGRPYFFKIARAGDASEDNDDVGKSLKTFMYLPNLHRLTPQEMGIR
jgi:prepilin-type N-terminal cleavage/methylation domain-containing protein